jgi:acetaldehyde dehydrogenase (acetylating)
MGDTERLRNPVQPGDPSIAQQVFDICCAAVERAGGYLVQHPDQHNINVVAGGHQVTITVVALDRHH